MSVRYLISRVLLASTLTVVCISPRLGAQDPATSELEPVNVRPRGFRLFGLGDFAITGMRTAGASRWFTTSAGPGNTLGFYSDLPGRIVGGGGSFFEIQLWMASARSDWLKHSTIVPSLENVKGGGYNVRMNFQRWMPENTLAFTGRDGSVGTLHSGATSESGTGTCRDNSGSNNAFVPQGLPLLAASDCPPTWANGVFSPERPVPDTTWLQRFKSNPAAFTFDDWKFSSASRDSTKLYGSFQTYGATNDYGRETVARFGNVMPSGSGPSELQGYPMGIEWEFQAFTYEAPTLADAMIYKVNIINRSEELYGVGLDFDSLYLGIMLRPFHTSAQNPAMYAVPGKGAMYGTGSNVNGQNCYGGVHGANVTGGYRAGRTIRGCTSNASATRGFAGGAQGIVIFKSPLGDLRNKKFTDPASPFFFPAHPNAGDTITFNQANACGFSCGAQQFFPYVARAAFGAYTNNIGESLAGRGKTAGELSDNEYFDLVHNEDFPSRWSPATGDVGAYNKYVPGNWDYNKDGKPDTLYVTSCGRSGCVTPWTDTLPGGFPNNVHNAYHLGSGPTKLKAGDTTSYVVSFISTRDSSSFIRQVDNMLALYQSFWLFPEPPCPANIVSASATGGNRQFDTFLTLFLDQSINNCQDKFLLEQARLLKADTSLVARTLKFYNPRLVNQILARALPRGTALVDTVPAASVIRDPRDTTKFVVSGSPATAAEFQACRTSFSTSRCAILNDVALGVVDTVFVFKSCDNGNSYTNSGLASCTPAPARDVSGQTPGFPWQAYARLSRDASGRFPATFADGNVTGGVTYTYVIVGQTFSGIFPINRLVGSAIVSDSFVIRPRTVNGLTASSSNRNVATVYVPASVQAGAPPANIRFVGVKNLTTTLSDTSAAFSFSVTLAKPISGLDTLHAALLLSDSAEVTIFDSDTSTAGITSTTVELFALADTSFVGTSPRRAAFQSQTFTVTGSAPVDVAGRFVRKDSIVPSSGSTPAQRYTFFRFLGRGPQATLLLNGQPVYVTDTLPATGITPAATVARNDFPGIFVGFDPLRQKSLNGINWVQPGIGQLASPAFPSIGWTGGTARSDAAYSTYRITFGGKTYGPGAPFTLNTADPVAVNTAFQSSLQQRTDVSATATDASAAAALNRVLGSATRTITTDSLAALKLPFTVRNTRTNAEVTIAVLKNERPGITATSRQPSQILGASSDTVRVSIPDDSWVPGDKLYFIETFSTFATDTVAGREVLEDSLVITTVNGRPDTTVVPKTVTVTRVTWGPATLGCSALPCNPVFGRGGTGFTDTNKDQQLTVVYFAPVGGLVRIDFDVSPTLDVAGLAQGGEPTLKNVRVVPNPYVMFSQYEQVAGTKRLLFTNLPATGTLNIYTASGQFVQRLSWTEADLDKNCNATVNTTECQSTGDLYWNLRTKEDLEIGAGFYIFVIKAEINGRKQEKLGKFVIIH
ncbi:MAG: hypothetical protein H0W30_03445 [Gemmatimonadaceae bacterium]|nr:hypothetical protein [Gemmatimonadaceae bacterium]